MSVTLVTGPPVDLDIRSLRVPGRAVTGRTIGNIRLVVRNNGSTDAPRPATIIGVQGGVEVYNQTIPVSDPLARGNTTWTFPPFSVTQTGTISWTATIADDDPDVDRRTATTRVPR